MPETQIPLLNVEPVRAGGIFHHWKISVDGVPCGPTPSTCAVSVGKTNNAVFVATISDPNAPSDIAQRITFASNPIGPPTSEIKTVSAPGTGPGKSMLIFFDHNQIEADLKYVLNFNNAPSIDPIIKNGGHGLPGPQPFLPTTTAVFALELGLVLFIGFILGWVLRRRV